MTDPPSTRADPDIAIVLTAYAAFATGDIDRAVACLDPRVEWVEPQEFAGGGRYVGPEAVHGYLSQSRDTWSQLTSQPTAYRHGDRVVVIHRLRGQLTDGSRHEAMVADVFTVKSGLITHMQAYADPAQAVAEFPRE